MKINPEKYELALCQRGIDPGQMARRMEVSLQSLHHQVYKAKRCRPSAVAKIAKILRVPVEELLMSEGVVR